VADPDLSAAATLLVVDDVGVVRRMAHRLLTEAGYRVFEAADGPEALEVVATARAGVDLALVDVVMPELSGVDLVRCIRARWPHQRVLFMSAHPAEILVQYGLQHPNVLFLAKPFTVDELLAKVTAALTARPQGPPPAPARTTRHKPDEP
jgi:CheY-like chemotaxis protein